MTDQDDLQIPISDFLAATEQRLRGIRAPGTDGNGYNMGKTSPAKRAALLSARAKGAKARRKDEK